ncbi:MAG TPA: MaoC family dehydratase [Bryobacteraceae bacterium]|nr:MaoC family dehydratase [Bryobacteraceae bacterium]
MRIIESLEELRALTGQEVAVGDWFTMDQSRIDAFAGATGDHQWIHQDVARAKAESPYGGTIAHGFLTLSMLSSLSRECFDIGGFRIRINYGLNRVRFPAAVPAGARIRPHFTLQSVEEIDGGYQLVWVVTMEVEGGRKPALYAEWVVRLYR